MQGTIDSLPPGSGDPPPADAPAAGADTDAPHDDPRAFLASFDLRRTPNLSRGAEIDTTVCQTCHGPRGEGGQPEDLWATYTGNNVGR